MVDRIYVISCSEDLAKMGVDRTRSVATGLEETSISLDWSNSRIVPIVAVEKVAYQVGETHMLSITPVRVPPWHIVLHSFYGVNGMGHLFCIGASEFKSFREERVANKAIFQSRIKSSVLPGDLLGQVIIVPGKQR